MSPSDFDPDLEDLHNKSVGRLIPSEGFDTAAFARLYDYLCNKAELIKSEHVVSKQVMIVLLSAQSSIENAAQYNPQAKENLSLASKFSLLLGLIAIGESPRDRQPGVPRLV
ncbi:hypothetical protein [Chromobacterium aquaticum]|uniref:Uncharacterized protein n=1 Tax=Chromobacterium aquaticum TaxID=467180 RepID=A0ABV8ZQ03_9NEIS|nr:hypothetical protein [Chromobacterium aquaticum]MCD5360079.1 hypothetical protein [Chromobacterium aquaticum]